MDKETPIDLIEKYLNNELSVAEQQAFGDFSVLPDFREELQRRRIAHKLLDYSISTDLREELQNLEAADQVISIRARRNQRLLIWSAAAGILLLIGLFFFSDPRTEAPELALAYYRLPDNTLRGSSIEAVQSDRLAKGMAALESGFYSLAIATFDSITAGDENYLPALYFQAHGYYLLKQYAQAEAGFAKVLSENDLRYSEAAAWYALLSCLAQDSNCRQRLDMLVNDPNHAFHQQALEIARRLK